MKALYVNCPGNKVPRAGNLCPDSSCIIPKHHQRAALSYSTASFNTFVLSGQIYADFVGGKVVEIYQYLGFQSSNSNIYKEIIKARKSLLK